VPQFLAFSVTIVGENAAPAKAGPFSVVMTIQLGGGSSGVVSSVGGPVGKLEFVDGELVQRVVLLKSLNRVTTAADSLSLALDIGLKAPLTIRTAHACTTDDIALVLQVRTHAHASLCCGPPRWLQLC
jgi:hypothetical protein